MIVHLNISEDQELRKAILNEVRAVLKSDIRAMLKPLIDEILFEKSNFIIEDAQAKARLFDAKIKGYLKNLDDELNSHHNEVMTRITRQVSSIIEGKMCRDWNVIDEIKTEVIKNLTAAFKENLKN